MSAAGTRRRRPSRPATALNDTAPRIADLLAARYAAMTGAQRMQIAAGMFDTTRAVVLASLPASATPDEQRPHLLRRLYPEPAGRVVFPRAP